MFRITVVVSTARQLKAVLEAFPDNLAELLEVEEIVEDESE